MKIAIISDAIYPYNKGGKEKRVYETTTRLAKKGHEVHVYCMKWWKGENTKIENGVYLHAISRHYPLYHKKRRSIKQAVFFSFACFKLIKEDFDVLDADHMPHLILFPLKIVCLIKRKKMYVTWNEVWGRKYWVEYMGVLGNISALIEKLSALTPDKIISISPHTTNNLIKKLNYNKKIVTISMGIDFSKIQSATPSKNKSDIIFAGRFLSHKNIDVLIKSISILKKNNPNIVCFIIGEGPEKNNLIKQVKDLRLENNVSFFDFFENQNRLYSLMKSSKAFVLPSSREGFGIVVLEANASGIPVITIDHMDNASKDLINRKNGAVTKLDENEIATSIQKLLINKINPKDMINFAKEYDWNKVVNRVERAYEL